MAIRTLGSPSDIAAAQSVSGVTPHLLRALTRRIVAAVKPEQIYLFGSYAYGKPTPFSDLDLMIVTEEPRGATQHERERFVNDKTYAAIREFTKMDFDVITRTPEQLKQRLVEGHPFDREIVSRGQILYTRQGAPRRYHPQEWRNRMPDSKVVQEWIDRAEQDYENALQILRRRKRPSPASVCYNCQQAVEKYLKAFLLKKRGTFQHTHDLGILNEQCAQVDGSFLLIEAWVKPLTEYVVKGRYPEAGITMDQAREAVAVLKSVRKFILPKLK